MYMYIYSIYAYIYNIYVILAENFFFSINCTNKQTFCTVRHVTGNDKDYLRKSPEWFGRRPRLTKGHYRVYCQPMLPVKLEV